MADNMDKLKLTRITPRQIKIVENVCKNHGIKFKLSPGSSAKKEFSLILDKDSFYTLFDFLSLISCYYEEQYKQFINPIQRKLYTGMGFDLDFMLAGTTPFRDNLDAEDQIDAITDELVYRGVEYNIIGDDMEFEYYSAEVLLAFCATLIEQYTDNNQSISQLIWENNSANIC